MTAIKPASQTVYNVKDYGAKGDLVADDTAAIQAALNAAYAGAGGTVYFPAGNYIVSTLTYRTANNQGITLKGAGKAVSWLYQKSGTTDWLLKTYDTATAMANVVIEDLGFTGFNNQVSNVGGVQLLGTSVSQITRCKFSYWNVAAIQIIGGATDGDAMYNTIKGCTIQQIPSGQVAIRVTASASGVGSHPDGTNIVDNHILGLGASTPGTGIKIDAPTVNTKLAADSTYIGHNRITEVATPLHIAGGQETRVIGNRFEVVAAPTTMTITVANGAAWTPVLGTVFVGNSYATGGVVGNLTFTDTSSDGVLRIGETDTARRAAILPEGVAAHDRTNGQTGIYAPTAYTQRASTVTMPASTLRAARFVPSKRMTVTSLTFGLITPATANDSIDVGLYDSAGNRLASTGATAGIVNGAAGPKAMTIASTTLIAGSVYYVAFAYGVIGAAGALLVAADFGNVRAIDLAGASVPYWESLSIAATATCPATLAGAAVSNLPPIFYIA